jgi:hypothetical protein
MKKIIALMLALGLVVPANAVNRRSMRRQVIKKALTINAVFLFEV